MSLLRRLLKRSCDGRVDSVSLRLLAQLAAAFCLLQLASRGLQACSREHSGACAASGQFYSAWAQQVADSLLLAEVVRGAVLADKTAQNTAKTRRFWLLGVLSVADMLVHMVLGALALLLRNGWLVEISPLWSRNLEPGSNTTTIPVLLLLLRLAIIPYLLQNPVDLEDISATVLVNAGMGVLAFVILPGEIGRWGFIYTIVLLAVLRKFLHKEDENVPAKMKHTAETKSGNGEEEDETTDSQEEELDRICKDMIRKAPLLKGVMAEQPEEFLSDMMRVLKHETFLPGSHLATVGEVGHHMFFLAKGTVDGVTAAHNRVTLQAGTSFGEVALMRPMSRRTATLTAATHCEVFLLNQEAFDGLRSSYPALAHDVRQMVASYLRSDAAMYVSTCMRMAGRVAYAAAGLFFAAVYAGLLIIRCS